MNNVTHVNHLQELGVIRSVDVGAWSHQSSYALSSNPLTKYDTAILIAKRSRYPCYIIQIIGLIVYPIWLQKDLSILECNYTKENGRSISPPRHKNNGDRKFIRGKTIRSRIWINYV